METDGEYRLQVKVGVKNTLRRAGVSVRCDEKVPDKGGDRCSSKATDKGGIISAENIKNSVI